MSNNKKNNKIKQRLFPVGPTININKLKISDNSSYSMTKPKQATEVSKIIKQYINNKHAKITECCSNVGGNTISFAKYFDHVYAVEMDKTTYDNLLNNIKIYGLNNVTTLNKNYLDVWKTIKSDVVFLDPPWGGYGYMKNPVVDLFLSDINIIDIIEDLMNMGTKVVVLKGPINYNYDALCKRLCGKYDIHVHDIYEKERIAFKIFVIVNSRTLYHLFKNDPDKLKELMGDKLFHILDELINKHAVVDDKNLYEILTKYNDNIYNKINH